MINRYLRASRILAGAVLLQAAGCSFDTEAFVNDSIASLLTNISTLFITNTLADLLNVPVGAF